MAKRTSVGEREAFFREHDAGQSYAEIAGAHGVSVECVGQWCRRQRAGKTCVTPAPCQKRGGPLARSDPRVKYHILRLRLQHKRWGPGVIRYHLQHIPSLHGLPLPSVASIGRYLHQWRRLRRRRVRKPVRTAPVKPTTVHACWQLDFKMGIALEDHSLANLHTVCDPVGAACLQGRVTAAGTVGHRPRAVRLDELQETLRQAFALWGTRPLAIQTDGEGIFAGNPQEHQPAYFTLWLLGLGIAHRIIRPGKPTDNGAVERWNQTLNAYAVVGNEHLPLPALQDQLELAVYELALALPSAGHGCEHRPPVVAHPELLAGPRPYHRNTELENFDLAAVDAYLATFTWQRTVSKTGQVSVGGHHMYYSVGRQYAGQLVQVRFDPNDRYFVFATLPDKPHQPTHELARRPAQGFSAQDICNLPTVSKAARIRATRSRTR